MVNLYKRCIFIITQTHFATQAQVTSQPNYTKRRHVDVPIMRSSRTSYFHVSYRRRMLPGSAKALMMMRKSQDGDTDELIICRV